MEPIVVEATRGGVVEARHLAHAVAVSGGKIVASAGDPSLVTFFRSSAKPLQALPVVRARPDLDEAEIAIACASHLARPEQLEAVRSLLAKAPASEDELECGPEPTRLEHNCSGKHAGLLALCRARGWASEGYRLPDHPCQQALQAEIAAAAEVDPRRSRRLRTDAGSLPSRSRSSGWPTRSRASTSSTGAERIVAAMRAHPELIRGPGAADTVLMETLPGWVAKGGAEGLLCAAAPDGLGVALKIEDGSQRGSGARSPRSSPASGSTRDSSELSRSRTRAARSSERFVPFEAGAEEECPIRTFPKWSSSVYDARAWWWEPERQAGRLEGAVAVRSVSVSVRAREESPPPMLSVDIALPEVEELQRLIEQGLEKGYLTYDEIVSGLDDVELTKEQVEDFYTYLIDHSIELVEGVEHKALPHEEPLRRTTRRLPSSTSRSSPRSIR